MDQKDLYQGGPTPDEILTGGASVELNFVNRELGRFEHGAATVSLIPIKHYPALRSALGNEDALVTLYLNGRPDGGGHPELTPASHELVMDVGRRVNAHFFACWLPRQRELEELTRSGLSEDLIAAAAREFVATYKQQPEEPEKSATSGRGAPIAPPVGAKHWRPSEG